MNDLVCARKKKPGNILVMMKFDANNRSLVKKVAFPMSDKS